MREKDISGSNYAPAPSESVDGFIRRGMTRCCVWWRVMGKDGGSWLLERVSAGLTVAFRC